MMLGSYLTLSVLRFVVVDDGEAGLLDSGEVGGGGEGVRFPGLGGTAITKQHPV